MSHGVSLRFYHVLPDELSYFIKGIYSLDIQYVLTTSR